MYRKEWSNLIFLWTWKYIDAFGTSDVAELVFVPDCIYDSFNMQIFVKMKMLCSYDDKWQCIRHIRVHKACF